MQISKENIFNKNYELTYKITKDFLDQRYKTKKYDLEDNFIYHKNNFRKTKDLIEKYKQNIDIHTKANFLNSLVYLTNYYIENTTPIEIKKEIISYAIGCEISLGSIFSKYREYEVEKYKRSEEYSKLISEIVLDELDKNSILALSTWKELDKNNLEFEDILKEKVVSYKNIKLYLNNINDIIDDIWENEKNKIKDTFEEWVNLINVKLYEYDILLNPYVDKLTVLKY